MHTTYKCKLNHYFYYKNCIVLPKQKKKTKQNTTPQKSIFLVLSALFLSLLFNEFKHQFETKPIRPISLDVINILEIVFFKANFNR